MVEEAAKPSSAEPISMESDVFDLTEKMKDLKTEKIITVEDEPVICKNWKNNPCLGVNLVKKNLCERSKH